MDDDETRARISEIAEHCKMLLGDEDQDLVEAEDAEDEGGPEMEKALSDLRTLVAQVQELRA